MRHSRRTPKIFGSSYEVRQQENKQFSLNRSWRGIVIVVIIIVGVTMLGRLPIWRLTTVELKGDKDSIIATELDNLIGESIFSSAISRLIKRTQKNVAVSDFVCRRGLPNILRCTLTLRQAEMIWKTDGVEYLMDKHGVLFAIKSTNLPELLIVEDSQKQPVSFGSVVASAEIINQYYRLAELLKNKQLKIQIFLLNESLYQITVIIERAGKNPIQGLFILSGDINTQVEALAAVLAAKGDSITERIDVRVPGYVYTK